jgi:hypothetical protein
LYDHSETFIEGTILQWIEKIKIKVYEPVKKKPIITLAYKFLQTFFSSNLPVESCLQKGDMNYLSSTYIWMQRYEIFFEIAPQN